MRLLILNHIENAFESLRSTRLRTNLTMLGVTIGVASITMILSLSGGATKVITDQVEDLGGNIAVVRPGGTPGPTRFDNITSPVGHSYATSSLTEQDVKAIQQLPSIEAAVPIMLVGGNVSAGGSSSSNTPIVATTPDLVSVSSLVVKDGDFIDSATNRDTAVIGAQLSINLFGTDQSLGQNFKIRGQDFTVIGVLKRANKPINYNNIDFDHAAIVSMESGKIFNQGVAQIQQIDIKAKDQSSLPAAIADTKKTLTGTHKNEQDFSVLSGSDLSRPTSQLFFAVAAAMTAVAAVSLLVGGIGIMNIMLVTVAERTREIGIRKALGASNGHITAQFLIESLAIGIGGGFFGYVLGYLLAFIVSRSALTFDPLFSWNIAYLAIGTSVLVGVLFGLYPALRASRKDPIEALRQYH